MHMPPPMDHYPPPPRPYTPSEERSPSYSSSYSPSYSPSPSPSPPPPRVARKAGKNIIWWPADEGSLASRSIGKVNIDCRLRLSESKWGVLDGSQPAGILYVDLTFDQPAHCRLSSATVLISLEEYEEGGGREKEEAGAEKSKDEIKLSRLRVCEFGPKLLTGEPTTLRRRTEYNFTPEVNAGVGGFGGLGVKRQNSIHYVSRWVLKGNTIAPADKRRKTPGVVYRTLKWDLTENELAFQPEERSVVHTAFAFEHELKRFYIKVEISGKLSDAIDRLKHRVFPPRLKKNQGTLFTLVDLGAEDKIRRDNLDSLARRLEKQMRERNLTTLALETKKKLAGGDPSKTEQKRDTSDATGEATGGVDLADLARATEKFAPASSRRERDSLGAPSSRLSPGQHLCSTSTPTPSLSSMDSTVVASQPGHTSPPVPPAPAKKSNGRQNPKTAVNDSMRPKPETEDSEPAKIAPPNREAEDHKTSPSADQGLDCEEEQPSDHLKPGKNDAERAIKVVAAELQFIEVLVLLRAWAYATFLALFIRNQQRTQKEKQRGISAGGEPSKVS